MDKDLEATANFAIQKGKRDSDRLVEECLKAIARKLNGQRIRVNGRECVIKQLGDIKERNEHGLSLMFDVKKPGNGLAHIEFSVRKTGWEMNLMEPDA